MSILTLNAGSSSIKFAIYRQDSALRPVLRGMVDRIGHADAAIDVHAPGASAGDGHARARHPIPGASFDTAAAALLAWLEAQPEFASIAGAGHRVVHGMQHSEPETVSDALLDELRRLVPDDPEHLPGEIRLIELLCQRHPALPQLACFDTAFHHAMPRIAQMLPIPRRYEREGLRRYGFHGLSYEYLMEELARHAGARAAQRPLHRHKYGVHADGGPANGHAFRRSRPRRRGAPGTYRGLDRPVLLRPGESRIRAARDFGDERRHARPARR
jgi:acetate kinase